MKCKQKSCNRNKNLLGNGYYSVCNETMMDIRAEHDAKNKVNEALLKDLIVVNEKLKSGEVVDQNDAIRSIIGGIIALINKNAGIDEHLEARILDLEVEKNTAKSRLQNLESWVLKQDENLKEINKSS